MKKYIIAVIVSIILGVGLTALYYAYANGYIRVNYPSFDDYPVRGIDVSHHQKAIDWARLDKKEVQFAFIKATEGGNHKDSLFQENWRMARDNNIPAGAYHFFTFCKGGEEQARNYIHYVPKDSIDLPPIVDLEYAGNCKMENRREDLIHEIFVFLEIIEDHYDEKVIIYTTNEFYRNYLINQFQDNYIWIRDILSEPNLPDGRRWLFWQYTNRGQLDGINTLVDQNAFSGSRSEFEKMLRRG